MHRHQNKTVFWLLMQKSILTLLNLNFIGITFFFFLHFLEPGQPSIDLKRSENIEQCCMNFVKQLKLVTLVKLVKVRDACFLQNG